MFQFSSVHLLSRVQLFVAPWTAARQAFLSITNSRNLLKLMSIVSVMPSNHLILCRPLLLPSIFPSIRVFSNESALHSRWPKYWSFSFNISPSNEHPVSCKYLINCSNKSIFFSPRNFNLKNRMVLKDKDLGATTCEIVQILNLLNLDLTLSFD